MSRFAVCYILIMASSAQAAPSDWQRDYATAKTLARTSGKPMLVVFR